MAAMSIINMNHSKRYQDELESEPEVVRFFEAFNWLKENDPDYKKFVREWLAGNQDLSSAVFARYDALRDPRTPAQREADQHDAENRETHESARP